MRLRLVLTFAGGGRHRSQLALKTIELAAMQRTSLAQIDAAKRAAEARLVDVKHALARVSFELTAAQEDLTHVRAGAAQTQHNSKTTLALLRVATQRWQELFVTPAMLGWKVRVREQKRVRKALANHRYRQHAGTVFSALCLWIKGANQRNKTRRFLERAQTASLARAMQRWVAHLARRLQQRHATTRAAAALARLSQARVWSAWQAQRARRRMAGRVGARIECWRSIRTLARAARGWSCVTRGQRDVRHLAARRIQAAARSRQSRRWRRELITSLACSFASKSAVQAKQSALEVEAVRGAAQRAAEAARAEACSLREALEAAELKRRCAEGAAEVAAARSAAASMALMDLERAGRRGAATEGDDGGRGQELFWSSAVAAPVVREVKVIREVGRVSGRVEGEVSGGRGLRGRCMLYGGSSAARGIGGGGEARVGRRR